MDYSEILTQTKTLLGQNSDGSGTFTSEDYAVAIQWAQEQAAQHLGLTYLEFNIAPATGTDVWGDPTTYVVVPDDAIQVTRVEVADTAPPPPPPPPPTPYFTLTVSPPDVSAAFVDPPGNWQADLTVTINRFGGHVAPVDITFPIVVDGWDGFGIAINSPISQAGDFSSLYIDDVHVTSNPAVIVGAPDSFPMHFAGTGQGWSEFMWDTPTDHVLSGDDGTNTVLSNSFNVEPPSE